MSRSIGVTLWTVVTLQEKLANRSWYWAVYTGGPKNGTTFVYLI